MPRKAAPFNPLASEVVTAGVRVSAEPSFDAERSEPNESRWFFAYTITITNERDTTVQLVARRWEITDADGHLEVVEGPGVVGEQPWLEPGESFTYTSGCPLGTSHGVMEGTYLMVDDEGVAFEVRIAPFTLGFAAAIN